MHTLLNNTGQGDHVLEAELFVRTTKDSCHTGFAVTPFNKLPITLTIGLVLITVFWNNSVAAADGVSCSISSEGIITGRSLKFHKHCKINFGSYVKTAEEGDNTTATERNLSVIAISPTDNSQGNHTFMNVNTGQYIYHTHWTPLTMLQHIIDCLHQLSKNQLRSLEFCDCNNQLMISKDDDMYNNTDDESYDPTEDDDANEIAELHDNKDAPPMYSENNAPVKEDVEPYPGEPGIIGYGNGNDAEAIPAGVYHDSNDANPILPDDAPYTGGNTPHIPRAKELQITGLIPNTTDNTGVPNNTVVR